MKNTIILALLCLLFVQCNVEGQVVDSPIVSESTVDVQLDDFVGIWEYIDNPENMDIPNGIYTIEIEKEKNELIGKYCAIAQKGNRIDCSPEDDFNLDIKFINNHLEVKFYSFYGAEGGKAKIELKDKRLVWEITETPKGDFYIPKKAEFILNTEQDAPAPASNDEGSLKKAYEKSTSISLPIEFSYEFAIELNDFTTIESGQEIPELAHLSEFQFAKLPSIGKTKLLLVSGYLESGQTELYLLTLNESFSVIDKVLLYTHQENEGDGILTRFEINKDYQIRTTKEEDVNGKKMVLETKLLKINANGKFVKAQ